jgi:hypothetical protein
MVNKNWREIKEGIQIANFKKTNILNLEMLDDGVYESKDIDLKDKEGNKTGAKKNITTLEFHVIDLADSREKLFPTGSKRLISKLSNLIDSEGLSIENLKGYILSIEGIGTSYDRDFNIKVISEPKIEKISKSKKEPKTE